MIDERTPNLSLPLPHPANTLDVDVVRLRNAFALLDARLAAIDALLQSDDPTLDTIMELVAAIKADRTTIQALLSGKVSTTQYAADMDALDGRIDGIEGDVAGLETSVEELQAAGTSVGLLLALA